MSASTRAAGCFSGALLVGAALTCAPAWATTAARVVPVACGGGSLTTAIVAANLVPSVLRLSPSCTYTTTAGALPITGDVTIVGGPSTTIRRDPDSMSTFSVFAVVAGATLRVRGIHIVNGDSSTGGGINDFGTLVLDHVTLSNNVGTAPGLAGGAIRVQPGARASVSDSVLNQNNATVGAGVVNSGLLTVIRSRIVGNVSAGDGGGVYTDGGTTRIVQSTVDHNVILSGNGGGIITRNNGTTSLDRTRVTRNRAVVAGGGIFTDTGGTVTLRDSIVRGNTPDNCSPVNSVPGCAG